MEHLPRLQPPPPDGYGFAEFIRDMLANAPVERASVWLRHAECEYPKFSAEFRAGIHETPDQALKRLARHWPPAHALRFSTPAKQFIARLQAALRNAR